MASTIEWLESIVENEVLRFPSGHNLENILDDMQTSDELRRAAGTGDAVPIKQALGDKLMGVNSTPVNDKVDDDDEGDNKHDPDNNETSS